MLNLRWHSLSVLTLYLHKSQSIPPVFVPWAPGLSHPSPGLATRYHSLSTYCLMGNLLSTSQAQSHLIPTRNL